MTEDSRQTDRTGVDDLREELAEQFIQAAARPTSAPRTRRISRRTVAVLGVTLALIPGSLAVAGVFDGRGDHTYEWDGVNVKVDGEIVECPVDDASSRGSASTDPSAVRST